MKASAAHRGWQVALAVGSVLALSACSDATGPDSGICIRAGSIFFISGSCLGLRDGGPRDAPPDTTGAVDPRATEVGEPIERQLAR